MNPTIRREVQRATRTGATRAAATHACPQCNAVVLRGLDADVAALPVVTDPHPLTVTGEVLALAGGRVTYDLTWRSGRYELDPRNSGHIKRRPAGTQFHVVAGHQCGRQLPPGAHGRVTPARYSVPDEPQF